jgi:diguanylate cyclase (GGDEF)-like protein
VRLISTPLASALDSIIRRHLPEALRELLQALSQALTDQDCRMLSHQDVQACEDFLRYCKVQGKQVSARTCSSVLRGLSPEAADQSAAPSNLSAWRLVDDEEVEDLLMARRVVGRLRESVGELEGHVCGCFNRLVGHYVADADHPLSLEFLLRQLQAGLQVRIQPLPVRALFQAEASRVLSTALLPYLQALVAEFDTAQVQPLAQPRLLVPVRQAPQPFSVADSEATYRAIRQLRRAVTTGLSGAMELDQEPNPVPVGEALTELLSQRAPEGGWAAEALLARLDQQGCALTPRQHEDAHLVSEVFQALSRQAEVAPTLQPVLQRLLLPVLTATLQEPGAIADAGHPVRASLDRILRLCDYCEPPNKVLEARLEQLVERITGEYRGDVAAFTACDAELDELLNMQQRAYRRSAERVMQSHRGRDILETAQRKVAIKLARLCGKRVPKVMLEWLDVGWRDLLVHEELSAGSDKDTWRGDSALTELLVQRLREVVTAQGEVDQAGWAYEIEHLLKVLRRRMDEFSAGHFQHASVLVRMREQLFGLKPVELVAPPPLSRPKPAIPGALLRWREQIEGLQQGDWLRTSDGQPLQLIWRNAQMDHYVLVDSQGSEKGSYGLAELARQLAEGALLVGEKGGADEGLVQRTLQDMVGKLYREIAHARSHDELTGLLNRRSFEGALAESLSASAAPSFLMAHIDQFSLINGHAGPVAGDACLRQIASRLSQYLPTASCMARVGGVEFAAVLPACGEKRAAELGEVLRLAIEAEGFEWQGHKHGLTLSIGVVEAAERHDVANLFFDLQSACNSAKESGRNRVHCFNSADDEGHAGLLAIAARVDDIVEREDLSLRVQQIAPASPDSQELPHYELLLVMQNELPLQDFIAAAERYHRMTKVDRWVLRRIFIELERHPQLWERCSGLSINLSGSSLNDDRLLGFIESLFERYAVDPRRICFELTETAAVANLAKTADLVRHLQRSGCTFSIDDFGVGFSSFDYLKRLPVDYVKIDGSFVKEIERSPSDLAMVRSINEIAHALGRRTVAEYVETPSIRAQLAEMGVDYVQGYGVQMPRQLHDWLKDEARVLAPC